MCVCVWCGSGGRYTRQSDTCVGVCECVFMCVCVYARVSVFGCVCGGVCAFPCVWGGGAAAPQTDVMITAIFSDQSWCTTIGMGCMNMNMVWMFIFTPVYLQKAASSSCTVLPRPLEVSPARCCHCLYSDDCAEVVYWRCGFLCL